LVSLGLYDHSWGLVTLGCGFPTRSLELGPCALIYGTPKSVLPTLSHKGLVTICDSICQGLAFYSRFSYS
jgi:hypothetical protein